MDKGGFVYLLASGRHGTLYCGVTARLVQRISDHRDRRLPGFTAEYGVARLVWFEQHGDIEAAIAREKRIKKWNRDWKINLIEARNPQWEDLAVTMLGFAPLPPKLRR